jgi:hypothetical protein
MFGLISEKLSLKSSYYKKLLHKWSSFLKIKANKED